LEGSPDGAGMILNLSFLIQKKNKKKIDISGTFPIIEIVI
jgi:hypothetical protein